METCLICGCTDLSPCVDPWDGEPHPCAWIAPELCSACRFSVIGVAAPEREDRLPCYTGLVIAGDGRLAIAPAIA